MNIFNKVTLKTLSKNKTRTIVTIIGIILSASMFTAVTTSISSLQNYMLNVSMYNNGDWEGVLYYSQDGTLDAVRSDDYIKDSFEGQVLGYSHIEDAQNDYKPYVYLLGADDGFIDKMPVNLTEGRFPGNSEEIVLPNHLRSNGGVQYKLGDTITLNLGDRTIGGENILVEDKALNIDSKGNVLEELKVRMERTYTVVGFMERPGFESYEAPGYTAVTLKDDSLKDVPYNVYFTTKAPKDIYGYLDSVSSQEEISFVSYSTNSDVLRYRGASSYDSFYSVLYSLAAILFVLIVFGSVSLIYNAFAISVSERTKQFGLLSSIGATKKQLGRSVFYEAFTLSVIGIPLGILLGITGIGVTFYLIGDRMAESLYTGAVSLRISVSPMSIIIAAALALVTVFISAYIPSRRATRITAIEAIRQSNDVKITGKNLKTSKLVYKFFGLEGMLAEKQYKRNKKRYRATVLSLFISVVLFISASSFVSYLTDSVRATADVRDYDIAYYLEDNDKGFNNIINLTKEFSSLESVTRSDYYYDAGFSVIVDESLASDRLKQNQGEEDEIQAYSTVYAIEDSAFIKLLEDNGLDKSTFMNPDKPLAIVTDFLQGYDLSEERFISFDALNKDQGSLTFKVIDYDIYNEIPEDKQESTPEEEYTTYIPINFGYVTDKVPYGTSNNYGEGMMVFYPQSLISKVFPAEELLNARIVISSDNHEETYEQMVELLQSKGMPADNLINYASFEDNDRNMILIVNVFSYGFIVLISLIAVANVFNTISTGINLRRREFAMLKSVGMTQKGFNKMMIFESILYGVKGLIYGLPVATLATYAIYLSINEGVETDFYIPVMAVAIAVLSVFAVVFASTVYSMRKIKKDNPIDALKNENL